ncbi:hypothetical protein SBOR_3514 [Sclerotinia borealis F-4128]|uniref:Uncharacterized protein n=1 Tax=Sclerotinia borealis (strain F-4128) TaxID=1432307 RepID=W9CNP4_SCLBF|nr:hypothetical protein SBOR_3514 [Sclerotinia borealis F-4128]
MNPNDMYNFNDSEDDCQTTSSSADNFLNQSMNNSQNTNTRWGRRGGANSTQYVQNVAFQVPVIPSAREYHQQFQMQRPNQDEYFQDPRETRFYGARGQGSSRDIVDQESQPVEREVRREARGHSDRQHDGPPHAMQDLNTSPSESRNDVQSSDRSEIMTYPDLFYFAVCSSAQLYQLRHYILKFPCVPSNGDDEWSFDFHINNRDMSLSLHPGIWVLMAFGLLESGAWMHAISSNSDLELSSTCGTSLFLHAEHILSTALKSSL